MFDYTSRYYSLETAAFITNEGMTIAYKRRRFLPPGEEISLLVEVTVNQGDRLDMITARTLGDPEHYWRVCDANNTMNPPELTEEIGRVIRIPVPQV